MSNNQVPPDGALSKLKLSTTINTSRPALFKMVKYTEEFYFDSSDFSEHEEEFTDMEKEGWVLAELVETLPAYLSARLRVLEQAGLVPAGWGYKKK